MDHRPSGLRLATVGGVPVYVGGSWAIIAVVLVALIGPSTASRRPDLGVLAYGVGALFALLLLVAVLVHEAAHAMAARGFGLPVVRIVADLWGGHTAFESGRSTPGSAAVIAVVGPLANGALALAAWAALGATPDGIPQDLLGGFALLNGALAAFNLLPGLPLDGGALVESAVWRATGSRNRGMVVAGWAGRVVTVLVVVWFVLRPLAAGRGLDLFDIAWTLFIAFFLWAGASGAIRGGRTLEALSRIRLADVMRPVATARPEQTMDQAAYGSHALVLVDGSGSPVALVSGEDAVQVPAELWGRTPLSAVSRPQPRGWAVEADPSGDIVPVVMALQEAATSIAAVTHGGRVVGVVLTGDVNRAMERN
jgi:Zn-dependent protease